MPSIELSFHSKYILFYSDQYTKVTGITKNNFEIHKIKQVLQQCCGTTYLAVTELLCQLVTNAYNATQNTTQNPSLLYSTQQKDTKHNAKFLLYFFCCQMCTWDC